MASDYGDDAGEKMIEDFVRFGERMGERAMYDRARRMRSAFENATVAARGAAGESAARDAPAEWAKLDMAEFQGIEDYAGIKEIIEAKLKAHAVDSAWFAEPATGREHLLFRVMDAKEVWLSFDELSRETDAACERAAANLAKREAREAADIVAMKSEIDSWAAQQTPQAPDPNAGGQQQVGGNTGGGSGGGSTGGGNSGGGSTGGGTASGMNYAVPGSCPAGSGYCYGHSTGNTVGGSAYPARQCTLWAYLRRSELGLPVGSYMGNGEQWDNTARSLGYLVNNTPHYGAVMVFERGQYVNGWYADPYYGHVAVVERVNADGSVLISEGGTGFATFPAWETVYNAYNYTYIHY